MFDLRITTFEEFRMLVKLIRNESITEEEVKNLSDSLKVSTDKLLSAEAAQRKM